MVDFGNLSKLEVKEGMTAEFLMPELGEECCIIVAPAAEPNKPYFNAMLKEGQKSIRRMKHSGVDSKVIQMNRDMCRKLFPQYVVRGWRGLVDAEDNEVPYSVENCKSLLEQLPDWLFDELKDFAGEIKNFLNEDPPDVEEAAKN